MARNKMTWLQRQELHTILHWTKEPVATPMELYVRISVRCFLYGKDAQQVLENQGVPDFVAKRAVEKARVFLGNERAKRRNKGAEILKARYGELPTFTHENFRVTIDPEQDRNFGMVSVTIYALVEVWVDEDEPEKEYLINYSDYKTKEWLTKLLVWGLMNKREISIRAATEAELTHMRMFTPKERVPQ